MSPFQYRSKSGLKGLGWPLDHLYEEPFLIIPEGLVTMSESNITSRRQYPLSSTEFFGPQRQENTQSVPIHGQVVLPKAEDSIYSNLSYYCTHLEKCQLPSVEHH